MLPTREEAKKALEYFIKYGKPYDKEYATNKEILEAYSSGSLIEARTEGEIVEILNKIDKYIGMSTFPKENYEIIARALVGKV